MDALPFCHLSLSAEIPKTYGLPSELKTPGDHIRKRRLESGLRQKDVAARLGVDVMTVFNWEKQGAYPNLRAWPAILEFLGYDPRPPGHTVGEKLRHHREGQGLSLNEAAKKLCVDASTVEKWERQADARQNHISIPKITRFLGYNPMPAPETPDEHIRYVRLTLGLTQQQLAQRLGVGQDKVWRWETGRQSPSAHISVKLDKWISGTA